MKTIALTLGQIAELLQCAPPQPRDAAVVITGVAALEDAAPGDLSVLSSHRYFKPFAATAATAVLVDRALKSVPPAERTVVLLVDNAELAMARVLQRLAPPVPRPPAGIDPLARVDPTARFGEGAAVGPFCVVGARSSLGIGTILHAGVFIGDDVAIGRDCEIFPHVTVRERITIGDRVVIHSNSALGTDGFGYRWDGSRHAKIPQIGTVTIEDDVEIGSCVCIDRAKFGVTRVGRGSKIDNLVQIAHNVVVGPHCVITGLVGIAGSAKLGAGVAIGGGASVRDGVQLGDGVQVAGCAGVADDIPPRTVVSGVPAQPHRQTLRELAALARLPDLMPQVRQLLEQLNPPREK